MKEQLARSKYAAMGALAAILAGCSGEPGEAVGEVNQASSQGCTFNWLGPTQCIDVSGTGLYVESITSKFEAATQTVCGEHHAWDNKGKLNEYSSRRCIQDRSEQSYAFALNRDLPNGDFVCVAFTGHPKPACETIHN